MRMKEEREKSGLKLNIQKMKIMASSPITSWQINWEIVKMVTDFILGALKSLQMLIAAMELYLLLGRKVMTNLYSILKSRDITLPSKFCLVNVMFFPVVIMNLRIAL